MVIVTKNRYGLLATATEQAKTRLPCKKLVVVDSTEHPNKAFISGLDIDVAVYTPNAKLGYARQKGLEQATTEYVVFLDDDILISFNWFHETFKRLESSPKHAVVSSLIIFQDSKYPELETLCTSGRQAGHSGGALILHREKVLACGGWNKNVHFGEDYELALRLRRHGLVWTRTTATRAFHPITLAAWLRRAFRNGKAVISLSQIGAASKGFIIARTFMSTFVMPVYYLFRTQNSKVFYIYARFKWNFLLGCLKGLK